MVHYGKMVHVISRNTNCTAAVVWGSVTAASRTWPSKQQRIECNATWTYTEQVSLVKANQAGSTAQMHA
jgi:hypothetical protein